MCIRTHAHQNTCASNSWGSGYRSWIKLSPPPPPRGSAANCHRTAPTSFILALAALSSSRSSCISRQIKTPRQDAVEEGEGKRERGGGRRSRGEIEGGKRRKGRGQRRRRKREAEDGDRGAGHASQAEKCCYAASQTEQRCLATSQAEQTVAQQAIPVFWLQGKGVGVRRDRRESPQPARVSCAAECDEPLTLLT